MELQGSWNDPNLDVALLGGPGDLCSWASNKRGAQKPRTADGALLASKRIQSGESTGALHGCEAGLTGTGICVHGDPGGHRDGESLQEPW